MGVTKTEILASHFTHDDARRLWSKIERRGANDKWPWLGSRGSQGHGAFSLNKRRVSAHAAVYALLEGSVPVGKLVRHTCDEPDCCNPSHLLLGEDVDNAQDAVKRQRRTFRPGPTAEKRERVARLLADPAWVEWSNATIGKACGVNAEFVRHARKSLGHKPRTSWRFATKHGTPTRVTR